LTVVSAFDAFMRTKPSQMPGAGGHSLGNANALKAEVLFEFLTDHVIVEARQQGPVSPR
jgi:hypothetical protein